jgi:hypothetical protein
VRDKPVPGRIGKHLRHRITGSPRLHFTVVDRKADEVHAGARISRVDVGAVIFQTDVRERLDIPGNHLHRSAPF